MANTLRLTQNIDLTQCVTSTIVRNDGRAFVLILEQATGACMIGFCITHHCGGACGDDNVIVRCGPVDLREEKLWDINGEEFGGESDPLGYAIDKKDSAACLLMCQCKESHVVLKLPHITYIIGSTRSPLTCLIPGKVVRLACGSCGDLWDAPTPAEE